VPGCSRRAASTSTGPKPDPRPVDRAARVAARLQVVFGTDYPYPHNDLTIGGRRSIDATAVLTDSEREAIFSGNAAALLPKVARLTGKNS
jgi:predicted TIM-barrel fold metal-dependent hydrolase